MRRKNGAIMVNVTDAGKGNKAWRKLVSDVATIAMRDVGAPLDMPLVVYLTFYMPRPMKHYKGDGLRTNAPKFHTNKPDALKLARSTEDAMTGIVYKDDSQTVILRVSKLYDEGWGTGCRVEIREAI